MIDNKQVIKPNDTPILFVNFSDSEFTGYWDKQPYTFAASESKWIPFWLAMHFSKHLVDREMNKLELPTDHPSRESFTAKCIGNKPEDSKGDDPLGIEVLNRNMEAQTKAQVSKKTGNLKAKAASDESTFAGK